MRNVREERIDKTSGQIMVIVPHQDDEILMCAGILRSAVLAGLRPVVVMVTNGDCGSSDGETGRARLRETLNSLALLGVGSGQVEFLGYADTGMPREESFLYRLYRETDGERVFASHCCAQTYGLPEKQTFHRTTWGAEAAYTRKNLAGDLESVIRAYRPDKIFTTHPADTHGDHEALFWFTADILRDMRAAGEAAPKLYGGLVHSPAGDDRWPARGTGGVYGCPEGLDRISPWKWEERVRFAVPEEMRGPLDGNLKHRAVAAFPTALKPDAAAFLFSFVKDEELFWQIEIQDTDRRGAENGVE